MFKDQRKFGSKADEALDLLRKARANILSEKPNVTAGLRTCLAACHLLGKVEESNWIKCELSGYPNGSKLPNYRMVWVTYYDPYGLEENVPDNFRRYPLYMSIHDAEYHLNSHGRIMLDADTSRRISASSYDRVRSFSIHPASFVHMMNCIIENLLAFINKLVLEADYGGIPSAIFEEIRAKVDEKIVTISPAATNNLKAAYETVINSGNGEDWKQVALECRSLMKDVADAIYPSSDKTYTDRSGREHSLGDPDYKNRLLAFIDGQTKDDERRLIISETEHLAGLLDEVYRLSNKGVHAKVSKLDAHRCLVYTYLLLGDILILKDRTI